MDATTHHQTSYARLPFSTRYAAMARATELREQIKKAGLEIAALPLPDHYQEQGRCLARLAFKLNHIPGDATAADARDIAEDLQWIWEAVDPLLAAIGDHASANFQNIDIAMFTDQVRGALQGNATHDIDAAADFMARE